MKHLIFATLMIGLLGCSDPAANAPAAKTSAAPAPTVENKPNAEPKKVEAKKEVGKTESLSFSNADSKVEFVGAKVTDSHAGGFNEFSGKIDFDPANVDKSTVSVEIKLASLFADSEKLAGHLKDADFFDVAKFTKATFNSSKIEKAAEGYSVTGVLDLHGVKKEISFPAAIKVEDGLVKANAEFSINRNDWGISYPGMKDNLIKDGVLIKLDINAKR